MDEVEDIKDMEREIERRVTAMSDNQRVIVTGKQIGRAHV